MTSRSPPRFVPTLTEVVQGANSSRPAPAEAALSQEQLAQRVLQRLDLMLDHKVREAIASVVLEQTSALAPLLRERIESVVRQAVSQAVAEELQTRQRSGGRSV